MGNSGNPTYRSLGIGFSAPSFANHSDFPMDVIPFIGGTIGGAEGRAWYKVRMTGDQGPICGDSSYRTGLDDWCAGWDKNHPKPAQGVCSPFSSSPC